MSRLYFSDMSARFAFFIGFCVLGNLTLLAQAFTVYNTGAEVDGAFQASGGVCLMGGASESDDAMTWFLERAGGGDVLVLRASGSDGYNNYIYSDLGVDIHRVTTVVCQAPQRFLQR